LKFTKLIIIFAIILVNIINWYNLFSQTVYDLRAYTLKHQQAHEYILSLKSKSINHFSKQLLSNDSNNIFSIYLQNLEEVIFVFLSDDQNLYDQVKRNETERLKRLENLKLENPFIAYFQAEIRIQWAILKMKFGEELSAVWSLRQAYFMLENLLKLNPNFPLTFKSLGLLHVILGSIPDNHQWIVNFLGMKGNVKDGMHEIQRSCNQSSSIFQLEACITQILLEAYVLKNEESSIEKARLLYGNFPENDMLMLLLSAMYLTTRKSELSYSLVKKKEEQLQNHVKIYAYRMLADAHLYKGEYTTAMRYYRYFLNKYKGQNYIKDTYYKIFLCYWLNEQEEQAIPYLEKIKNEGKKVLDSDKRAYAFAQNPKKYHKDLMRIRLLYDGGYEKEALEAILKLNVKEFGETVYQNEYYYRLARIYHALNKIQLAKENYLKCIETYKEKEAMYFAPNAAYALGCIYLEENNLKLAEYYFRLTVSFKNHEYKNSLDNKAKAKLAKIEALKLDKER